MRELNFNKKPEDFSMAEKEFAALEYFRNEAFEVSAEQFDKIYKPLRDQLGIDSPAVMLYKNFAQKIGVDKILNKSELDDFVIIIDKDSVSDSSFVKYLKEHECWEIYIAHKEGFNMKRADNIDASQSLLERYRPAHRYSCYKEFQMAYNDGKADEYLKWWQDFYKNDKARVANLSAGELNKIAPVYQTEKLTRDAISEFIDKNQNIKEWAYKKVLENKGGDQDFSETEIAA